MVYPVVIEPFAKKDIREAKDWLEEQKPGLGEQFRNELESHLIELQPIRWPTQSSSAGRDKCVCLCKPMSSAISFSKTRYM